MEKLSENKYPFAVKRREEVRYVRDFKAFITYKGRGTIIPDYLGADIGFVREWLQDKFINEMSWENYGEVWVVDHIVPFRMFDPFDESDLKLCWNYRNLVPLYRHDNLKKEGNVFFAFELLYELKGKDFIYGKLFERILPEVGWMIKYINNYHENRLTKDNG